MGKYCVMLQFMCLARESPLCAMAVGFTVTWAGQLSSENMRMTEDHGGGGQNNTYFLIVFILQLVQLLVVKVRIM